MRIVEYSYLSFPIPPTDPFPKGQTAWRPITAATLTASSGQKLRCAVCLDSGADSCLFPASFAPLLGLDLAQMPKNITGGVGSSANTTYFSDLAIDLGYGITFKSYVGFTTAMDALGFGLLGQEGFFEFYTVRFSHKQRKFTIEKT